MSKKTFFIFILSVLLVQLQLVHSTYVSLSVSGQTIPTTIEPGEKANLILTITNVGNDYARNLKLRIKPHTFITPETNYYEIPTIGPTDSKQVVVPITISPIATEGTTALFFSMEYSEGTSVAIVKLENSVSISITKRTIVQVKSVNYSKELIQPGDTVMMKVELENVGRGRIKDLTVSLRNFTLPFVPADTDTENYLGTLEPNQMKSTSFNLIINRNAKTLAYNVPITLTYYDESGLLHTEQKYVGMKIYGKPSFVVTIEKTEKIYSGGKGEVTVSIANRGTANAELLMVTIDSPLYVMPKEIYVGSLEPDDIETISLDIDATTVNIGRYPLNLKLTYKDPYNQEFSEKKDLELNVRKRPVEIPMNIQIILILIVAGILYWKRGSLARLFRKK
jgi:hypothetical protein